MQDTATAALAGVAMFAGLERADLDSIERACRWVRYSADQLILDRDSTSTDVYFVVEGEVRIVAYSAAGREIQFAIVGAGDYFGDLAAIDGLPRSASVTAATAALLASVSGEEFLGILERHSSVALHVLRRLARIIRSCDERIIDLTTLSAFQRVYSELLRMAVPDAAVADQWVIRPYPPEREIASRTSTSRETVARAVGQLRQANLVLRKGRNLFILDRPRIEALVESYRSASDG
jgi:CRP-like cAMP-binding protein